MSALDLIKSAKSLADLAHLMGFKASAITYLIRKLPPAARYTQFDIPKRSGGTRTISAPIPSLKLLQKHLAEHLAKCEQEIEEKRKVSKSLSHGFKIGHSILTNAQTHRKKRFVFNIDLKDFFDTINFGRVRGFFIKNNDFQLHPDVATTIAQIACHNNSLPQGAPTSPVISNLITNVLDIRLAKLAKRLSCSYTRYADDITFSTSRSEFPKDLVATSGSLTGSLAIGKKLRKEIQSCGFSINEQKTRLQFFRSRQDVTGLVVNRQISAPIEYRRMLRAMVNRYCKTGTYERHSISIVGEDSVVVKQEGSPASLHGMLNYILQIERWRIKDLVSDPIPPEKENGLTSTKKLLRRFLFYKEFANPTKPAVIFEGETDFIYLREALRALAANFPTLVSTNPVGSSLNLKLHRNTPIFKELFGLKGGSDNLKKFVLTYRDSYKKIDGPKGANPIIVVTDHDSGFAELKNLISGKKFGVSIAQGAQFFHVTGNLYVILTCPFQPGKDHCIEQCFDAATLGTLLGGKKFNWKEKIDPQSEYGKAWFAEKVIAADAANVDFSGFQSMLDAFKNLLAAYKA